MTIIYSAVSPFALPEMWPFMKQKKRIKKMKWMRLLVELSRDTSPRCERTAYNFNRPTESSSRKRLLRWVVLLCATGQTKVDFKRPAGHKEAQKFTFACCSRAREKNATVRQFVRFRSQRRNLPSSRISRH